VIEQNSYLKYFAELSAGNAMRGSGFINTWIGMFGAIQIREILAAKLCIRQHKKLYLKLGQRL
jgi:hypothetical protein